MKNLSPMRNEGDRAFVNLEKAGAGPSKTLKMHIYKKKVKGKLEDPRKCVEQMVYKFVNTEKGSYLIYPSFGLKKRDVFFTPKTYAFNILKHRIKEGLELDDRVKSVTDIVYDRENSKKHDLAISFTVNTIYGPIDFKEVLELG